jgi:hypothetical protein
MELACKLAVKKHHLGVILGELPAGLVKAVYFLAQGEVFIS